MYCLEYMFNVVFLYVNEIIFKFVSRYHGFVSL